MPARTGEAITAETGKRDILIGVDVGGTFTDAVVIISGVSHRAKSASTYPDIGRGVLAMPSTSARQRGCCARRCPACRSPPAALRHAPSAAT
jgi:hypothetical protein